MEKLPKIARILNVEPFKITLLWNNSEIRLSDFSALFKQWEAEGDTRMSVLNDWEIFKQVTVSHNNSLCWENVPVTFTFKGKDFSSPLELDALELYRQSVLLQKPRPIHVGTMLRAAREAAGLSQADVAFKSGTTRNYISRIENDQSDIQLETLQKIVELGIGGEMIVRIKPGKTAKSNSLPGNAAK